MTEKIFLNDGLVDADKGCISPADGGFLYGAGLFETMRSYQGVVWRLDDHLERLFGSAGALSMDLTFDREFVADAIGRTLVANELSDARIRLTVSGGPVSRTGEKPKSTLLITAAGAMDYPSEYYENGVLAVISNIRQNQSDPLAGHKCTSYYPRMLALQQARAKRATEALWFTMDARLAEGCISNVFIVKDGRIRTPRENTPVLAGITRKAVLEIAAGNGIDAQADDISLDDVLAADEVFLTNVVMKVLAVNCLEKHAFNEGKVGPVTRRLAQLVDEDIKEKCG